MSSSDQTPTPPHGQDTSAMLPSAQGQPMTTLDFHFDGVSQLGLGDSASVASSQAPSNRTERLAALFPIDSVRFSKFKDASLIIRWLAEFLQLDATFIARMECCGYVTPSIIMNRFGLSEQSIAESFAVMGPSYVLDPQVHVQSTHLVLFARYFITDGHFSKPKTKKSWKQLKMSPSFNKHFNAMYQEILKDCLMEYFTDTEILKEAVQLMRGVRSQVRRWIRND